MSEQLEIYKVFVNTITANEGRRQKISTAYIGMIAAITTATAAIPELPSIVSATVILAISITWFLTVVYFRNLAQAKFTVINEIEESLSVPAFALEWRHFKKGSMFGWLSLTKLEMVIPALTALVSSIWVIRFVAHRIVENC